jgi:hypothetical protein
MRVNVYRYDPIAGETPEQRDVELRDVLGGDMPEYYRALVYLRREGRFWTRTCNFQRRRTTGFGQ